MASVRVAVRVRPMSNREKDLSSECIIHMEGNKTSITNLKSPKGIAGDSARKRTKTFSYDFSYDSADCESANYISQEKIFKDLGSDVLLAAFQGYNACVFAYGQTGSGKSFTMMGSSEDGGLIPRICEGLFGRIAGMSLWDEASFCTKVSYLEIYNERIRDLLRKKSSQTYNLRVREHPKGGPYVEDLSNHLVQNYCDMQELMEMGNAKRTTASTVMNNISSRSHAIFTINFTQAKFGVEMPCETVSKIHLVDLAGSERANNSGSSGVRLKEGGSINKSLATLGNVISALADRSDDGVSPNVKKRHVFVPYRDSVLTWLLKDSLGGNSKTIMIATISPADINYSETLSTLRYANRAKNIINKPTINEDSSVKLIRELRAEIARLKALLGQGNQIALLDSPTALSMEEKLHENEARVLELTKEWTNKWNETQNILKEETLALRKEGIGVVLDSELPHLIGIDEDLLSTGIILYHLKEGRTCVGRDDAEVEQDIVLHGPSVESEHCLFENLNDLVTLVPLGSSQCFVNGIPVMEPYQLSQGAVILLGRTNMFRFNHPKEAAKMREKRKSTLLSSPSSSVTDVSESSENLSTVMLYNPGRLECRRRQCEELEYERRAVEEMEEKQSCENVESEHLQQEMATLHKAAMEWLCAHKQEESLKLHSLDLKYQLHHLLAKKGYYEERRMLRKEKEQEFLQIARQMSKTFYELEKLKREWDEWSRTVKAEGRPLVEEKLDLKEQLCEKYSVADVLMFYMQTLEEVLRILKTCQGQHSKAHLSVPNIVKVGLMEKLKAVEIEMVESQLSIHKETLRSWCLSTTVKNKQLNMVEMQPQNQEHKCHHRAVMEEEQQKQQDGVAMLLRCEPCLRESGERAVAKVDLGHLAISSDSTTQLGILEQIWLSSAVHHAWGLRTNLKTLYGTLAQDQERLEHEIYQSKQKMCDCRGGRRGCPLGALETSGHSSPAIGPKSCVAGLSPFADDRLLSYVEGVPGRLQKLDEMNTDTKIKPSECLKEDEKSVRDTNPLKLTDENFKELPHGIRYLEAVISTDEISRVDGKTAEGFVEKLSPEESDCVNHLEKGHLCKEGEMLTTAKTEKEVDVSPHKSGRLEMPAESPAEEKGHQACLHGEQDRAENDVSQSETSSGGSGSNQSQSSTNAHPLTGNTGEELCGVTLLLLLSASEADGGTAVNRTEVQETSEAPLPGQSLPRSPLAEMAVEGQLSDAGMRKVSTKGLVEPGQEAVSEHKIVHQYSGDDQSQSCGYKLAGKLSWLNQGAGSHLRMTERVIRQIVKQTPFHSWHKQVYMIVKHLPLCQTIHLEVTIKSDTGGTVQLSDILRNFQNYIKDQTHLQLAQTMAWSHRSSLTISQDVQFFCQKLVEFPLSLHKLQSLTPQRLLACLGRLIPDPIPNSRMLLGVYWLHFANSHQSTPQPGCVLLFESIIYAIVHDRDLRGDKGLAVFHQLQLQHIREVHVGFAGQHIRVLGATEHTIFTMYTYSKQLTQELCQALLRVLSPEAEELSRRHPLLQGDLMELSLNWKAHIPDLCLNSRLRLSSQFKRALADLVYFLHGNMKEKPSLADVHLLLYTSVRVEVSPYPRPHAISWLLLTDTHVGLVQEDGVFHPTPRSITLMPKQPHFEQVALRKLLDVRCILVADRDSSIRVDIVFKATRVCYQEVSQLGKNNMTAIPSLSEYYLFPYSEVWKLTFGCTKEAAFVINHLSMV